MFSSHNPAGEGGKGRREGARRKEGWKERGSEEEGRANVEKMALPDGSGTRGRLGGCPSPSEGHEAVTTVPSSSLIPCLMHT